VDPGPPHSAPWRPRRAARPRATTAADWRRDPSPPRPPWAPLNPAWRGARWRAASIPLKFPYSRRRRRVPAGAGRAPSAFLARVQCSAGAKLLAVVAGGGASGAGGPRNREAAGPPTEAEEKGRADMLLEVQKGRWGGGSWGGSTEGRAASAQGRRRRRLAAPRAPAARRRGGAGGRAEAREHGSQTRSQRRRRPGFGARRAAAWRGRSGGRRAAGRCQAARRRMFGLGERHRRGRGHLPAAPLTIGPGCAGGRADGLRGAARPQSWARGVGGGGGVGRGPLHRVEGGAGKQGRGGAPWRARGGRGLQRQRLRTKPRGGARAGCGAAEGPLWGQRARREQGGIGPAGGKEGEGLVASGAGPCLWGAPGGRDRAEAGAASAKTPRRTR
jgi:hypothetical protein